MTFYGKMIRETLAKVGRIGTNPMHVEAYMRLEHDTLDGLSPAQFRREVEIGAECAAASSPADNDRLARSFGLHFDYSEGGRS